MRLRLPSTKALFWVGSLVLLALASLAVYHLDFAAISAALTQADWRLVSLAALLNLSLLYFRVFKWRFFFDPGDVPRFYHLSLAAFAAYTCNNVIPARVGALVQVWLLSQKDKRSPGHTFGTIVLLRIFDGASLAAIGLLVFWQLEVIQTSPEWDYLRRGGLIFSVVFFGLLLFLALLHQHEWLQRKMRSISRGLVERSLKKSLVDSLEHFWQGFSVMRRPAYLLVVVLLHVVFWGLCGLSIQLHLQAFGIPPQSWLTPFLLLIAQAMSFAIPSPGNIGPFHAATVAALALQGVAAESALALAIVMHASFLLTNTLPGLVYLWRENIRLRDIGAEETSAAL